MTIPLTTYPPDAAHEVVEVVAAVGVSTRGFLSAPDLGVAMAACRDGLRLRARELGADMVAGCRFQVDFGPSAANVTGFGTAIRLVSRTGAGIPGRG
jgi:hypothetical protein